MLSACEGARTGAHDIFSSTAATLLRRGIPAVVAMQYEITDEAAIEFARAFYEALADAVPVDAAVGEARKTISRIVSSSLEWGTPVLYMHAPDGVLFDVHQPPAEPARRSVSTLAPENSQSLPAQGGARAELRGLARILAVALPVLAVVIGMLLILPRLIQGQASTGTLTADGGAAAVMAIVSVSSTANNTAAPTMAPPTAIAGNTPGPTATLLPAPTALPPGFVRLEAPIYATFDPNVPGDVRLGAGRFYRPTGEPPIGRYCHVELPPDGLVWVLCVDIGVLEPPTPAPSLIPTAAPAPAAAAPSPDAPPPTAAPSPATSSVSYRVDIVKIALVDILAFPGCQQLNYVPEVGYTNNVCIDGPGSIDLESQYPDGGGNSVIFSTNDHQVLFPRGMRVRVIVRNDFSGFNLQTIGNNEVVPEPNQYYKIVVRKIEQ